MKCCPITHYPIKKVALSILATFVFIFASDFLLHGVLLKDLYMSTANLWRPEEEMKSLMKWMWLNQLFTAIVFTITFALIYRQFKTACHAWKIGLLLGLAYVPAYVVQYMTTPLPSSLLYAWSGATIVQTTVMGAVLGLILKCANQGECKTDEHCKM